MNDDGLHYLFGVDGGGTHTRAALWCAASGRLTFAEAGPGNLLDVGDARLAERIEEVWQRCFAELGVTPVRADAAFLGLAGVATAAERARVATIARRLDLAAPARIGIDHDLRVALAGALAGRPGLVLVVGTGSACLGQTAAGVCARAGGHGPLLDDSGSAFDLGRRAVIAALRADDGRGPATPLGDRVRDGLGVACLREVIRRVAQPDHARTALASLAPAVCAAAAAGDAPALAILEQGAAELALMAGAVADRLALASPEIAWCGGLIESAPTYRARVIAAIHARLPGARTGPAELSAVLGAVLLAAEQIGPACVARVIADLRRRPGPPPA